MKKIWLLVAGFMASASVCASAETIVPGATPKVEEATPEADKAAVHEAASEADQWAAKHKADEATKQTPPSPNPPVVPSPSPSPSPSPAQPAKTAPPVTRQPGLNEMKGKFQSKSYDPKTLRVIVDGGYNVEFTYDTKTSVVNGGSPITIEDLDYNDEVIVRYSGKELYAIEIDRVGKAPRPQ